MSGEQESFDQAHGVDSAWLRGEDDALEPAWASTPMSLHERCEATIDALRARVVVAEEDADRLAGLLSHHSPCTAPDGVRIDKWCTRCSILAAHRVAVSSRPKATQ